MVFTAKVEDLEIRGHEVKQGKNGEYAVVRFDAQNGDRLEFIDRDKDRFDEYKRGQFCDIWLRVTDTAKYTNFTITEMKYRD
jgi:ferredoxin-NADP reductase